MIINMNGAKAPETPSSVLQEKTVTPETLPTVIGPDEGYDGLTQVTVNPDAQLKAENIRSGKTIFGVVGSFVGEPQPTDELDITKLSEHGMQGDYSLVFAYSPQMWVENPERFTELDFTKADNIVDSTYVMLGYDGGALGCNSNGNTPTIKTNGYLSTTNYYYKSSRIFEAGEIELGIPYHIYTRLGFSTPYPTRIKGSLYLIPMMLFSSQAVEFPFNPTVNRTCGYDQLVYEVEVDSELTFVRSTVGDLNNRFVFKVNIPRIESTITGGYFQSVKNLAVALCAMVKKIVIS